jgi:cytidylate kinase
MDTKTRSIEQLIDEHVKKWEMMRASERGEESHSYLITVSREPGTRGGAVAKGVAERLGLDFFHREIIQKMAESARISTRLLETLDEKGLSVLEDWIATLVDKRHLWPDQYLRYLMRIIGTVGKHGNAVIVGRGANFILPPKGRFRVRIVAPLKTRIQNVANDLEVPVEEAKRRVLRAESDRRAFVRKYFHADISDPVNYDVVVNTGTLSFESAVAAIIGATGQ